MNLNQVTLPSTHIQRSIDFFCGMGFTLIVNAPHYARFECPEGDSTFSVHLIADLSDALAQTAQNSGVVVYFESNELDSLVARLTTQGYVFDQPPTDESWLWREARLKDPDGNVICLFHAGQNRHNPPWRVDHSAD